MVDIYVMEYLLTPGNGDVSAEAGWRSEEWRVRESTLGDVNNNGDTFELYPFAI